MAVTKSDVLRAIEQLEANDQKPTNANILEITGGSNGYVLATDGAGNLSWVFIDPSVTGDGGNASSSLLLLASLNGGNAISA